MILRLFLVLRSQCNCLNFAIVEIIRFITRSRSFVTGYYYIFRTMRFIKVSIIFFFFLIEILAKYQRGNAFKSY